MDDDVVDEADESSDGEQVAPRECELAPLSVPHSPLAPIRPPSESSRLTA